MVDYKPIPIAYKGAAKPLGKNAISAVAIRLMCHPAAIKAVWRVETNEKPAFDETGRPTILYERHVFRRLTQSRFDKVAPTISGPAGNYGKFSEQYYKLDMATEFDPVAAWKSCSWGMMQVMGFNHELCGYLTVTDFVAAMCESADAQLDAFVKFVQANALGVYLRDKDWRAFARGYNGPAYEKYDYHIKLEDAYKALGGR